MDNLDIDDKKIINVLFIWDRDSSLDEPIWHGFGKLEKATGIPRKDLKTKIDRLKNIGYVTDLYLINAEGEVLKEAGSALKQQIYNHGENKLNKGE